MCKRKLTLVGTHRSVDHTSFVKIDLDLTPQTSLLLLTGFATIFKIKQKKKTFNNIRPEYHPPPAKDSRDMHDNKKKLDRLYFGLNVTCDSKGAEVTKGRKNDCNPHVSTILH